VRPKTPRADPDGRAITRPLRALCAVQESVPGPRCECSPVRSNGATGPADPNQSCAKISHAIDLDCDQRTTRGLGPANRMIVVCDTP
jgi:hypothetical protein